jgi:hypothetical protein
MLAPIIIARAAGADSDGKNITGRYREVALKATTAASIIHR